MEPCLTKSLTHAPSRPTTSAMVPAAAPAIVCSLVEANGPDRSLTLIPGLAASNWSIRSRRAPWGSSGSHHCENSRVVVPPEPPLGFAASAGLVAGPPQPATSRARTARSEVARHIAATPFLMCVLSHAQLCCYTPYRAWKCVFLHPSTRCTRGQAPTSAYSFV